MRYNENNYVKFDIVPSLVNNYGTHKKKKKLIAMYLEVDTVIATKLAQFFWVLIRMKLALIHLFSPFFVLSNQRAMRKPIE